MFYSVKLTEMQYRSVQFHLISSRGRFLNFQAIFKPIFIPYLRTYLLGKILYSLVLYRMFVPIGKKIFPQPKANTCEYHYTVNVNDYSTKVLSLCCQVLFGIGLGFSHCPVIDRIMQHLSKKHLKKDIKL